MVLEEGIGKGEGVRWVIIGRKIEKHAKKGEDEKEDETVYMISEAQQHEDHQKKQSRNSGHHLEEGLHQTGQEEPRYPHHARRRCEYHYRAHHVVHYFLRHGL